MNATPYVYWRYRAAEGAGVPNGALFHSTNTGSSWIQDSTEGDDGMMFEIWGMGLAAGNICVDQLIYQHAERMVR